MRVRMRQAQRRMKGVKLQYTDANRVTFDDVAGVGPAKARACRPVPLQGLSSCWPVIASLQAFCCVSLGSPTAAGFFVFFFSVFFFEPLAPSNKCVLCYHSCGLLGVHEGIT